MLAREVMTTPATCVRRGVGLRAAMQVLLTARVPSAPVVDDDGRLVGIVTELDLAGAALHPDYRAHERPMLSPDRTPGTVDEVMTHDVVAVLPSFDVYDVIRVMAQGRYTSVPVIDGDRVVGTISRSDVLRLLLHDGPTAAQEQEAADSRAQ